MVFPHMGTTPIRRICRPVFREVPSFSSSSLSFSQRWQPSHSFRPSGVSEMVLCCRSNRATPQSCSSSLMALETAGWEMWSFSAAREKVPHRHTAAKVGI